MALAIPLSLITGSPERTTLKIKNLHDCDTVLVYLTLNDYGKKYIHNVNEVFGIKSGTKLQGSFKLAPNDSVEFTPIHKALSGNISFGTPPLNCPYPGITLFEFTLNNDGIEKNSQETVDISCVAGVTAYGLMELIGGGIWTDNLHSYAIDSIENNLLYHNTGISGVFPFGCTNCTNHKGAPNCKGRPIYGSPNMHKICNVQRNAKNSGGEVCISYLEKPYD